METLFLKNETQTETGNSVIWCLIRQNPACVNEHSHMRAETIFHAGTSLGELRSDCIEVEAATAKDVGSESTFAQWETQNQIGRSAVHNRSGRVFRISIGPDADVAGKEIIDPQSCAKLGVMPDPRTGKMINGVFPEGTGPERVQGQFVGPVKFALVIACGFRPHGGGCSAAVVCVLRSQ